jgi:hypothetical protein
MTHVSPPCGEEDYTMNRWIAIKYRDFWDIPRIFFVEQGGQLYLFDCKFDRALDDYPETYEVFLMPSLTDADFAGSWADLWLRAVESLGRVPVSAVHFDPTRRAAIDADVFDVIRPPAPHLNGTNAHAQPEHPVS